MRRVSVTFSDGPAFIDAYFPNGILGGVLVESGADIPLGEWVQLDIRFANGPRRPFHLRGRVGWRRLRGNGVLKPGIGFEFPPGERDARDSILDFARSGTFREVERSYERVPARLRVKVQGRLGAAHTVRAGDLSEGGVFVDTPWVLPVGEEIALTVKPPFSLGGIALRGKVTWHRPAPDRGMGVQFLFENEQQRARIHDLVGKLSARARR